ncbi:MAG: histidine kinase [Firmicutes bacterium]|nr:histidine kinase [Bacillota bacterium]
MTVELIKSAVIPIFMLIVQAGFLFAVTADPYIRRNHRKIMLVIIGLVCSLIIRDYIGFLLDIKGDRPFLRTIVAVYGYCVRPVILTLFMYIVKPKRGYSRSWILTGINAAIYLTAFFSGICFSIDADNVFHRGPLGFTCHIVSAVLLAWLTYVTIREYGKLEQKAAMFIPLYNVFIIIASVAVDTCIDYRDYPMTFLTAAIVISNIFYYIWLHLQFVYEHEQDVMAKHRIKIMISQIQPHFLYNTLTTVQALCRIDPEKAEEIIVKFGAYLRNNLESLNKAELITFKKELEHTKIYTDIETMRFQGIRVEYDIKDSDFYVPALSVQPLVENAVRHGMKDREEGLITISAKIENDKHIITVKDDGDGFDTADLSVLSSDEHIGIQNVRERIEQMCGGTLEINSGSTGTTVVITIPEE